MCSVRSAEPGLAPSCSVVMREAQAGESECGRTVAGRRRRAGRQLRWLREQVGQVRWSPLVLLETKGAFAPASPSLVQPLVGDANVAPFSLHRGSRAEPRAALGEVGCVHTCMFVHVHVYSHAHTLHERMHTCGPRSEGCAGPGTRAVSTPPSGWTPPGGSWSVPGATRTRWPPPRPGLLPPRQRLLRVSQRPRASVSRPVLWRVMHRVRRLPGD